MILRSSMALKSVDRFAFKLGISGKYISKGLSFSSHIIGKLLCS